MNAALSIVPTPTLSKIDIVCFLEGRGGCGSSPKRVFLVLTCLFGLACVFFRFPSHSAPCPCSYDTCIIHAMPRGPFGSFKSGDGSKFLVLHGRVGVTQTVDDLKAGDEYALSFVAAERYAHSPPTLPVEMHGCQCSPLYCL